MKYTLWLQLVLIVNYIVCYPTSTENHEHTSIVKRSGYPSVPGPVFDQDRATVEPTFKDVKVHEALQNAVIPFIQPKPIVDTIQEHEKYGNDGSQHDLIGNAVVRGLEQVSQVINKVIDVPEQLRKSFSKKFTETLNAVGGRLIGLN